MLRELVGTYLDSLSEREFDAPLMAILPTQGFYDILHGSMEFGKDVIAKRVDDGILHQYAIQCKAGYWPVRVAHYSTPGRGSTREHVISSEL